METDNCTRCEAETPTDELVQMLDWLLCDICLSDI
jgi:hypothetical protein